MCIRIRRYTPPYSGERRTKNRDSAGNVKVRRAESGKMVATEPKNDKASCALALSEPAGDETRVSMRRRKRENRVGGPRCIRSREARSIPPSLRNATKGTKSSSYFLRVSCALPRAGLKGGCALLSLSPLSCSSFSRLDRSRPRE